jgi:sodium transport system ATP-binding protein
MIEARELAKRFNGVQAVRRVSFTAPDGYITGLLGPNGAGKTTTLRMIATLVVPTEGNAKVDGIDVSADPLAVRARIGVLSDARGLYARLTARENIAYYGALRGMAPDAVEAAIRRLSALLDMGALLDRRTDGFSQGERMKVAIARALVHDPPNVMLDEPTNGLDVMTTRNLREVIRRLRSDGKCVLFSSHVMQEISALCDGIVIMAHGAVVAQGTAQELLAQSGCTNLEDAFVHLSGDAALDEELGPGPGLPIAGVTGQGDG